MRKWDLDTERMTRKTLEDNYFNAVEFINDMVSKGDMSVENLRVRFTLSPQQSKLVNFLSGGEIRDRWSIFRALSLQHETDYVNAKGEPKLSDIIISSSRKKLAAFGLQILCARGQGYYIPKDSIAKLKQLVAEHKEQQEREVG